MMYNHDWKLLIEKNIATLHRQRQRLIMWDKSHNELDTAINETRLALDELVAREMLDEEQRRGS